MKNKKIKSKENENTENIPAFTNFTQYFEEFHKMFNHCKYNLVALNKKFDALEMFFKNYIIKDKNSLDYPNVDDYETSKINRATTRIKHGSNRRSRDTYDQEESNVDNKFEKEENFPISIEDLDYLAKNFISEDTNGINEERIKIQTRNSQTSSKKKKNQTENVITIRKKDVQLDESLVEFFGKNNIEEETFKELPLQIDKNTENNFVQKLFDYKTFSQTIKKSDLKEKDDSSSLNIEQTKEGDLSKWITRAELDMKSGELNEENFKILTPDSTLPQADNDDSQAIYLHDDKNQTNRTTPGTNVNTRAFSEKKLSQKKKFEPKLNTRDKEAHTVTTPEEKENSSNKSITFIYLNLFS